MRRGFHWKPVFVRRRAPHGDVGACPDCGHVITDLDGEPINPVELEAEESRRKCSHCRAPLWSLIRPRGLSASDQSRSEEHTSELQSLMRISYAVFCLKKKTRISQIRLKEHIT